MICELKPLNQADGSARFQFGRCATGSSCALRLPWIARCVVLLINLHHCSTQVISGVFGPREGRASNRDSDESVRLSFCMRYLMVSCRLLELEFTQLLCADYNCNLEPGCTDVWTSRERIRRNHSENPRGLSPLTLSMSACDESCLACCCVFAKRRIFPRSELPRAVVTAGASNFRDIDGRDRPGCGSPCASHGFLSDTFWRRADHDAEQALVVRAQDPLCVIDVTVQEMLEGGSSLAAGLNAAVVGLVEAGVALHSLCAAVAVALLPDGSAALDPDRLPSLRTSQTGLFLSFFLCSGCAASLCGCLRVCPRFTRCCELLHAC